MARERNPDSMKGQTSAINLLLYFHSAGGGGLFWFLLDLVCLFAQIVWK